MCIRDRLYDQARQWDKSVELRTRAAELTKDARAQAALFMEIGQLEETKRSDDAAALAAYERAHRTDNRLVEALRAQAQLHRKARRSDRLLDVLRAELERGVEVPRRLQIQLEVARLVQEGDAGGGDAALGAYLDVLAVEPDNATAIAGVERIARPAGRWAELARAFRGAPRTPSNLQVFAEALEQLGEWAELAQIKSLEIEAAATPHDKARLATALAALYETKLGDVDAAIRTYQLAATAGVSGDAAQRWRAASVNASSASIGRPRERSTAPAAVYSAEALRRSRCSAAPER